VADKEGGAIALLMGGAPDVELARALGERLLRGQVEDLSDPPGYSFLLNHQRNRIDRESRLFYAAISNLERFDLKTFAPTVFLDALAAAEELKGLPQHDREFIESGLTRLRKVVSNEIEFTPFPDSTVSTTLRSLMLVVLRPDPRRLAAWNRKETNASDAVLATALLFSGYLCGHKRLPSAFRPSEVNRAVAAFISRRLLETAESKVVKPSKPGQISALLENFGSAADGPEKGEIGKALAKACGWTDCFFDEYLLREDDLERTEGGGVHVKIRAGIAPQAGFSEADLREHVRLRFGLRESREVD
jgi:hypothetical protein